MSSKKKRSGQKWYVRLAPDLAAAAMVSGTLFNGEDEDKEKSLQLLVDTETQAALGKMQAESPYWATRLGLWIQKEEVRWARLVCHELVGSIGVMDERLRGEMREKLIGFFSHAHARLAERMATRAEFETAPNAEVLPFTQRLGLARLGLRLTHGYYVEAKVFGQWLLKQAGAATAAGKPGVTREQFRLDSVMGELMKEPVVHAALLRLALEHFAMKLRIPREELERVRGTASENWTTLLALKLRTAPEREAWLRQSDAEVAAAVRAVVGEEIMRVLAAPA